MNWKNAKFIKGMVGPDEILEGDLAHVAFIGRSNVGKSSVINALTKQKGLARTSPLPGRTQEINVYLIHKAFYLLDLPGYGYAKASKTRREQLWQLLNWYLFESGYEPKKVILIIDAVVGLTENDSAMLQNLEQDKKNIVILVNKIDKIKKAHLNEQLEKIKKSVGRHAVIFCSAKKNIGIGELMSEIIRSIHK